MSLSVVPTDTLSQILTRVCTYPVARLLCLSKLQCCRLGSLLCVALLGLSSTVYAAGDATAGKASYAICATCHGPEGAGNIALNAPRLAGQEGWYIDRQLKLFRDGARGTAPGDVQGMQMRSMAMAVAQPDAVANLIAYIDTLPVAASPATVEGDAAAGKTAYAICAACHGAKAEGNQALGGPRLAGLDDWYLVRQLENYKNNRRGYHASDTYGMQMKPMASTLATPQAINDVVAYINSLQ